MEVKSCLEGWSACGRVTLLALAAPGCGAREEEEEEEVGGRQCSGQRGAFPGRALTRRGLCAKHGYLKARWGAMPPRSCLFFVVREHSSKALKGSHGDSGAASWGASFLINPGETEEAIKISSSFGEMGVFWELLAAWVMGAAMGKTILDSRTVAGTCRLLPVSQLRPQIIFFG